MTARTQPWSSFHAAATFAGTSFVLFAILAGCGGDSSSSAPGEATNAAANGSTTAPAAPPKMNVQHPVVQIETNRGAITVRLDGVNAPGTVRNFLNYASEGFYDNTIVHYVDPGKMILAGGYAADRTSKQPRLAIRNEAHNGLKNTRGTIAMTRSPDQIDSATSQFFINLADAPQRDHTDDTPDTYGYCVFGEVTAGLEVAEQISQSSTTNQGGDLIQTPEPPVVITAVRVVQ